MFYYQQNYYSECHEVTKEVFSSLIDDKGVDTHCNNAQLDAERALEYGLDTEQGKKWHEACGEEKKKLPLFLFNVGHVTATENSRGVKGYWRKNAACRLNGLCMMDVDHLDNPREEWEKLTARLLGFCEVGMFDGADTPDTLAVRPANSGWTEKFGVLLIHITPSGHGLRFVFKADEERGNLSDNQAWLAERLGFEKDEACKDSSRGSFCVPRSHILYLNEEIFTYNNEKFEEKYGNEYRAGKSQPKKGKRAAEVGSGDSGRAVRSVCGVDGASVGASSCTSSADADGVRSSGVADTDSGAALGGQDTGEAGRLDVKEEKDDEQYYKYYGRQIPYKEIVSKLVEARGGEPSVGGRNNMLFDLVRLDLRHICNNDEDFCFRVAPHFGLSEKEVKSTIHQALCTTRYGMSRTLRTVLSGYREGQQDKPGGIEESGKTVTFNHEEIWATFKPLLSNAWGPVFSGLDDNVKFAGFLAAGAMVGTYLSAVDLINFYDTKRWRLSFIVYIIGQAASGKGCFVELNRHLMAPMLARDEEGRKWEEKYKEDKEKRATSSSNQKAKAMDIEHFPIRVLPGTISNAMRYRRMKDAKRVINGEERHLHCYIFESELSAKIRSEQGSWAGAQDLDCKSFSNEYAGNDYGNSQAVNGLIEVNMNQVITGTHDALNRKITARNILDGLCTRLVVFEMPDSSYKMLNREVKQRTAEEDDWLNTIGEQLIDLSGVFDLAQRVRVPKTQQSDYGTTTSITEALFKWGEDEAARCGATQDLCADYFRRRAPIMAARYAAVDAIMNDLENFKATGKVKVTWRSVELAVRLASYFQESQMYFFGAKVLDGLADERSGLAPSAKVQSKTKDLYQSLGDKFALVDVQKYIPNYFSAVKRIRRWEQEGIVKNVRGRGRTAVYKKIKKVL